MNFSDQRRQHVGGFQVEIVVGAIEVGRHGGEEPGPVLAIVGAAHGDASDLGDGVRLVGRFQRPGQEVFLLQRLGCQLRIDAAAPQEEEPLDAGELSVADNVTLDHQVVVDEIGRVAIVGDDPPHFGGGQKDVVGSLFLEKTGDRSLVAQIKLTAGPQQQVAVAVLSQSPH